MTDLVDFFWLMVGHSLADYPLQGQFLSDAKRLGRTALPWWIALTYHSFIHAGVVAIVTGSMVFAIAELVLHWLIDFAKTRGMFGEVTDQALHVACKAAWALG